jgi:ribosomal protein S18 acetylase RimI-like enzyme
MLTFTDTLAFTLKNGLSLPARRLTRADAPALVAFNLALDAESRRKFTPHAYDGKTLETMLRRSEAGEDYTLAVFDGPLLSAYFFLWYFRKPVPLLGIGMRSECQHQGLGKQLMSHLIEVARETGRDGVELTTMLDNHTAFALYQKCGFNYYKNVENVTGDGTVVIERAMFLALKPGAQPMAGRHQPPA